MSADRATRARGANKVERARSRDPVDVFNALADPTRRQILDALRHGEQSVSAIVPAFRMTRSAVSQHLGILREAGLVRERRVGRERRYRIDGRPLRHVYRWLSHYERFWDQALDRLDDSLARMP